MEKNTAVNPQSVPKPIGMFSNGVLSKPGRVLAIAGQTGLVAGRDGQDIVSQCTAAWENIKAIVEAAGGGMGDLVSINIYLKNKDDYMHLDAVRKNYLQAPYPASTAVAGIEFVLPEMLVEIAAIAVIAVD